MPKPSARRCSCLKQNHPCHRLSTDIVREKEFSKKHNEQKHGLAKAGGCRHHGKECGFGPCHWRAVGPQGRPKRTTRQSPGSEGLGTHLHPNSYYPGFGGCVTGCGQAPGVGSPCHVPPKITGIVRTQETPCPCLPFKQVCKNIKNTTDNFLLNKTPSKEVQFNDKTKGWLVGLTADPSLPPPTAAGPSRGSRDRPPLP